MKRQSPTDHDEHDLPVAPAPAFPGRLRDVQEAVARLSAVGVLMQRPVEIREWHGEAHLGCFVRIDAATCALHVGRGRYVMLDIARDLNGMAPSEATRLVLRRSGNVREPDSGSSYGA